MKNSVETELKQYILDAIEYPGVINDENKEDWHFYLFNEDYYIVGYYESSEWLKKHDYEQLEAANICIQYEIDNFGEVHNVYNNTETVVNMLAYIFGEELLSEAEANNIEELKEFCEN